MNKWFTKWKYYYRFELFILGISKTFYNTAEILGKTPSTSSMCTSKCIMDSLVLIMLYLFFEIREVQCWQCFKSYLKVTCNFQSHQVSDFTTHMVKVPWHLYAGVAQQHPWGWLLSQHCSVSVSITIEISRKQKRKWVQIWVKKCLHNF